MKKFLSLILVLIISFFLFAGCSSNTTDTEPKEMSMAELASAYMYSHIISDNTLWRTTYHATSPVGWMNDPNGFIYYKGKYHLFFQYYPYSAEPGIRYWGHMTSTDCVNWNYEPVALAPDKYYESEAGCWSGTSLVENDKLYIMYTGTDSSLQQQCLAVTTDGITFEKFAENPVISIFDVGRNHSYNDFRDPKLLKNGDYYYSIVSSRKNNKPILTLYRSTDLKNWSFVNQILNYTGARYSISEYNGMYECPDYVVVDGKALIITSALNYPKRNNEFQNINSCGYMVGEMNFDTGAFTYNTPLRELDGGFDFYGGQTCIAGDGRVILTAWMQNWQRTFVTQDKGWVGEYILPRELSYKNNRLYQQPIREIYNLRSNSKTYTQISINGERQFAGIEGNVLELDITIDLCNASKVGVRLYEGTQHSTLLYYDAINERLVFDRSNSGQSIGGQDSNLTTRYLSLSPENNKIKLQIFLDKSTIEVFANDGIGTMTSLCYPDAEDTGITFFSDGLSLFDITKYSLVAH